MEKDMGCCSKNEKNSEGSCSREEGKQEHEHDSCDKEKFFIELADEAWTCALKEKMKEYILKTQGDRLEELAKIVAEGNNQRWRHKMEKKQSCMDFKEKLCRFFGQAKK